MVHDRILMKSHLGGHVFGFHAQKVHGLDLSSQHLATKVWVLVILQVEVHGAELRPEALIVASCDVTAASESPVLPHSACLKSFPQPAAPCTGSPVVSNPSG